MREGVEWHYCEVSAAPPLPSAQSRGRPGPPRLVLAATVLGVVGVHLLLLQRLAGSDDGMAGVQASAAAAAPPTRVRTIVAAPDRPPPAAVVKPVAKAVVPRARSSAVAAAAPVPSASVPVEEPTTARTEGSAASEVQTHYSPTLPPAFEARFRVERGGLSGTARWAWSSAGDHYQMSLHTQVLGREISHLRSQGRVAGGGLEPLRFVEGRRGRDQRAVNFLRDEAGGGRISFSGPDTELPLPGGVQDRLSWLLQLAAIVDSDPALRQPGREVAMWVVGPRGQADLWTFVVASTDTTEPAALLLRREPRRAWDTEVQVWLDPATRHLPLRARWRTTGADEGAGVELWRESIDWTRAP